VLAVEGLSVHFGLAQAVRNVSWLLRRGEVLAIVGESGSGKSVTMQAVMSVLETPPARIAAGRVLLEGQDLLALRPRQRRRLYGSVISMVQQDAGAALSPSMKVGHQIVETLRVHQPALSRGQARATAIDLLGQVGISEAGRRYGQYPYEYSGGMAQRALIAMAIANEPRILIADEPTTALDVTVQAQIMELLMELRARRSMSLVLITHDLALVSEYADRILVMYAGRVMEEGQAADIVEQPAHPYTRKLLEATPDVQERGQRLRPIVGAPPSAARLPSGCPFHPRCSYAAAVCAEQSPARREVAAGHTSACHFAGELPA
jgi:oligopeptide/dipeptide ABC transporter ATP-binding protein